MKQKIDELTELKVRIFDLSIENQRLKENTLSKIKNTELLRDELNETKRELDRRKSLFEDLHSEMNQVLNQDKYRGIYNVFARLLEKDHISNLLDVKGRLASAQHTTYSGQAAAAYDQQLQAQISRLEQMSSSALGVITGDYLNRNYFHGD